MSSVNLRNLQLHANSCYFCSIYVCYKKITFSECTECADELLHLPKCEVYNQSTLLYPIMKCNNLTYHCYEWIISNIFCNLIFFVKFHENDSFNQVSSPVCHRINSFFFKWIFSRKSSQEWFTYIVIYVNLSI